MGWKRFAVWLSLGLVLSLVIGCGQSLAPRAIAPSDFLAKVGPVVQDIAAAPAPLPKETATLVANVGPNGLADPPRGDLRLVVISDLNSAYGSTDYDPEVDQAMQLMPFWRPDLVVCGGDMVAGQKTSLSTAQIQAMWAAFDRHVAAPLRDAGIPFGFTVGNHDASSSRGANNQFTFQRERELAAAYWNAPEHSPGLAFIDRRQFPFFYTFKQDDIFFMAWDGSSSRIPADKLGWVEQALASEVAQQAKARILLGHLPLYGVAIGRDTPGNVMDDGDGLRALLERYDVHTYISGHHHAYYPGHRGDLQLLHTGALGGGPRQLIAGNLPPRKTLTVVDIDYDSPELTRYTTYDMQTMAVVDTNGLPRSLVGHKGLVLRRDITLEALTPAEKAQCEQQTGKALCRP
ncbi:metallophosphoesterase [filamentous cyanobacterium CCP5]|nr:metallophosphoesterase [filamentous cyanobacterium CCP5]